MAHLLINYINNYKLLKIRIAVYIAVFIFLVVVAVRLLCLDYESHESLEVRKYAKQKWKLITTWFNLIIIIYTPICAYCDWRELKREDVLQHVEILNKLRTFLFSNIILPVTLFSDLLFWRLWHMNKELVMPTEALSVITIWSQHAMHTFSLVFVVIDLLLVPRQRPESMIAGISTLLGFISVYIAVCANDIRNNEYLYPCFKNFSGFKLWILSVYVYTEHLFYYFVQWLIVDMNVQNKKC